MPAAIVRMRPDAQVAVPPDDAGPEFRPDQQTCFRQGLDLLAHAHRSLSAAIRIDGDQASEACRIERIERALMTIRAAEESIGQGLARSWSNEGRFAGRVAHVVSSLRASVAER